MNPETEDREHQFLAEIEEGIRIANRQIIHQRIPALSADALMPLAISVARLRARYLETAFRISSRDGGEPLDDAEVAELRRQRETYEEGRHAFEALRHAVASGYIETGSAD